MWILDGRDAFANSAFEELRRYVEIFPSRCVSHRVGWKVRWPIEHGVSALINRVISWINRRFKVFGTKDHPP